MLLLTFSIHFIQFVQKYWFQMVYKTGRRYGGAFEWKCLSNRVYFVRNAESVSIVSNVLITMLN